MQTIAQCDRSGRDTPMIYCCLRVAMRLLHLWLREHSRFGFANAVAFFEIIRRSVRMLTSTTSPVEGSKP